MADYIDREALLKDIEESVVFSVRAGHISPEMRGANKITDRIKSAPTADVVEVVRCGECRYHTSKGTCDCPQWLYDDINLYVEPTDFCSYGERKVEE